MAGRGTAGREEGGRGGRGGRDKAGRGGRGGSFAGTPPPPPPARGRGRAGVGYAARGGGWGSSPVAGGVAPGRGRGFSPGRGSFSPSPSSAQQPRQPPFQRSPSGTGRGRGFAGSPGPGINQGAAFTGSGAGAARGKLFGRGVEAVAYDRDKEKGLWKVGPPAGQRFSAAWLRGLDNFVAWKRQQQGVEQAAMRRQHAGQAFPAQQQQAAAQPQGCQEVEEEHSSDAASTAQLGEEVTLDGRPPATAEGLALPPRPPVTAERLQPDAESVNLSNGHGSAPGGSSGEPAGVGSAEAAGVQAGSAEGVTEAAVEAQAAIPDLERATGGGEEELSRASSASSDMGWASVLGAAAAAAAASPGGSPSASFGSADAAASSQAAASSACEAGLPGEAASSQHRHWWPPSPPSLAAAQPVAVDRGDAAAAAAAAAGNAAGNAAVQLSIRLERQALTDPEAAMLADWCYLQRGAADVRKLWLFDNRLTDAGAEAVARILAAHPGMQEVHLSHNMLTLRGAAALLEALPVGLSAPEGSATEQEAAASPHGPGPGAGAAAAAAEAAPAGAADAGGAAPAGVADAAGERDEAPVFAAGLPSRPCWLRMEWNRISLEGLMQELESQHARRGLVVDLPAAVRADATPNLPDLPPYLAAAAAAAPAPPTPAPASRGARNTLQHQVERCHARLPWVSCQYQLPAEAAVLKAARRGWQAQQAQQAEPAASSQAGSPADGPPRPPPRPAAAAAAGAAADAAPPAASEAASARQEAVAGAGGPLLLFPDTSALLPMLGAGAGVSLPTFFTLDMLGRLAQQGRFGRALPAHEQVFLVVTDSVLKQLDGLKNDPAARAVVRRFLGQGLDAYGPAGADFLTVLGAHEGEGLLVEHDAAVAGSADASVGTKGQRADHRIVEVALFFQQEILRGAGARPGTAAGPAAAAAGPAGQADEPAGPSGGSSGSCGAAPGAPSPGASPAAFPVLLLSGDNAQVLTARAHGLPAARMGELAAAQAALEAALERGDGQLGASLLRSLLGAAATTGLGTAAGRSLQAEFDEAISVLAAAADVLGASHARLEAALAAAGSEAAAQDPAGALQAVRGALAGQGEGASDAAVLLPALRARLDEWQARVKSHQDPSRILRWAVSP